MGLGGAEDGRPVYRLHLHPRLLPARRRRPLLLPHGLARPGGGVRPRPPPPGPGGPPSLQHPPAHQHRLRRVERVVPDVRGGGEGGPPPSSCSASSAAPSSWTRRPNRTASRRSLGGASMTWATWTPASRWTRRRESSTYRASTSTGRRGCGCGFASAGGSPRKRPCTR